MKPTCLISLLLCSASVQAADRPNIVLILADDFGVGDINANYPEHPIRTPHLDQLVREGMYFDDAHSPSSACTPTRYGLLTGRYAWRTRLRQWVLNTYEPPLIDESRMTLPAMLQSAGYHTECIGKWHLGWNWPPNRIDHKSDAPGNKPARSRNFDLPIGGGPTARGFDDFFGVDLPNYPPFTFISHDRVIVSPTEQYQPDPSQGVVLPNKFAGSPMAPGWRLDQIVPELTRRVVASVHERADKKQPFFLYYAMTSPHDPISPSPAFRGKSGIAPIGDFLMETDWSVGQVLKAIAEAGIADTTIVIFSADNGHSHYTGWEKLVAAGHLPSGPFRGHKADIWEGGHRVPLIVRWPGRVAAGSRSNALVSLTDIYATIADVLQLELAADAAEDSASFYSALRDPSVNSQRTSLVCHSAYGEFAYREGPWKLVWRMPNEKWRLSSGKAAIVELYNLEEDLRESKNVAEKNPELVRKFTDIMAAAVANGATRAGASGANDAPVSFDTIPEQRWATE